MPLIKGQTITITITSVDHQGYGIATLDPSQAHQNVRVLHGLPGDTATATITGIKPSHIEASIDTLLTKSPDRVEPLCAHFSICSGCSWQHASPDLEMRIKKDHLFNLFAQHHIETTAVAFESSNAAPYNYRRRARLSVKYDAKKEAVYVGFRERNPRYIAKINHCPILPSPKWPELWVGLIAQLHAKNSIPQLEILSSDTQEAFILRILTTPDDHDIALLRSFAQTHGITVWLQTTSQSRVVDVFSETLALEEEEPLLAYSQGDVTLYAGPFDFVQVNRVVADWMLEQATLWLELEKHHRVLDLFCGLGPFSLHMAPHVSTIHGIELEKSMVHKAQTRASALGYTHTTFEAMDLFHPPHESIQHYDIMIVDPPRSGMPPLMAWADAVQPKKILYVSCNAETLVRDIAPLLQDKKYAIKRIALMNMFAQTQHFETMVLLQAL
jgi:23S rRNA (uracil1939-C5)-methyltransferase